MKFSQIRLAKKAWNLSQSNDKAVFLCIFLFRMKRFLNVIHYKLFPYKPQETNFSPDSQKLKLRESSFALTISLCVWVHEFKCPQLAYLLKQRWESMIKISKAHCPSGFYQFSSVYFDSFCEWSLCKLNRFHFVLYRKENDLNI